MKWNYLTQYEDRINTILIFLFIFLLPTQLGKHFFPDFTYLSGVRSDYLAPTLYITDVLVVLLCIYNYKIVLKCLRNERILFYLALLALTIPFSLVKELAVYRYIKIIEIIFTFIISYYWCHSGRRNSVTTDRILDRMGLRRLADPSRMTLFALLSGSLIQLILTILQFTQKHSIQGLFYWLGERAFTLSTPGITKASLQGIEFLRPYGTFSHPNSMAGFYLLMYFFVLTFDFASHSGKDNVPYPESVYPEFMKGSWIRFLRNLTLRSISVPARMTLLLTSSLLIFISFSKIAIGTYILLNSIYLLKTKFYKHCIFCFSARIAVFIVVGYIFLQAVTDPLTITKRLDLFSNSLQILKQYSITGVGLGNYLIAQNEFAAKYLNFLNQPVHNIFLLFIVETGILVGGIVLWELSRIVRNNLKNESFLFCFLVVLMTGMFDHYWLSLQQNCLLLSFIFSMSLRTKRSNL